MLNQGALNSGRKIGSSRSLRRAWITIVGLFLLLSPMPGMSEEILVFRDLEDLVLDGAVPNVDSYSPSVAVNDLDQAAVVWSDNQAGPVDTLMELFSRNLDSLSDVVYVNDLFEDTTTRSPRVAPGAENTFIITWSDNRSAEGLYDVYITRMNNEMTKLYGNDIRVNETFADTNVEIPDVTSIGDGVVAVCWVDDRQNLRDVYMRRFNKDGTPIDGRDFIVDPPHKETNATHPRVSGDGEGAAMIVWSDDRLLIPGPPQDSRSDVFARILPRSAVPNDQGEWPGPDYEIQVSDNDQGTDDALNPAIAGNGHGLYVVAWMNQTSDGDDKHIYAAVITSSGQRLTDEFQVDLAPSPAFTSDPAVTFLGYDLFLISWYDEREGGIVAGQIYDAAANQLVSAEFVITNLVGPVGPPTAAPFSDRAFVTTWPNGQSGDRDVLGNVHFWDLLGDLDVDARVSTNDLFRFATAWQPKESTQTPADFDVDGFVDANDVRILRKEFRTNLADRRPLTFSAESLGETVGKRKVFEINAKAERVYSPKARRADQTKPRRKPMFVSTAESGRQKSIEGVKDFRLKKPVPVRSPQPTDQQMLNTRPLRALRSRSYLHQARIPEKEGLFFFKGKWR